jgi:CBS domain-containing protein
MTTDLFTVRPDDLVDVAASVMQWKHVRHVPVENDAGDLVGLLSYRSLLRVLSDGLARGGHPVPVRDIMQAEPVTTRPDTKCIDAIRVMKDRGVSCLPVVLAGRLVGIVSERDFLELSFRLYEQAIERDG